MSYLFTLTLTTSLATDCITTSRLLFGIMTTTPKVAVNTLYLSHSCVGSAQGKKPTPPSACHTSRQLVHCFTGYLILETPCGGAFWHSSSIEADERPTCNFGRLRVKTTQPWGLLLLRSERNLNSHPPIVNHAHVGSVLTVQLYPLENKPGGHRCRSLVCCCLWDRWCQRPAARGDGD